MVEWTKASLVALTMLVAQDGPIGGEKFVRLIEKESGYDIRAVSEADCRGLGQLNPRFYYLEDYFDPEANMRMSYQALTWNYNYWLGQGEDEYDALVKGVASYNMGYMKVRRLVEKYGDEWLFKVPEKVYAYITYIVGDEF